MTVAMAAFNATTVAASEALAKAITAEATPAVEATWLLEWILNAVDLSAAATHTKTSSVAGLDGVSSSAYTSLRAKAALLETTVGIVVLLRVAAISTEGLWSTVVGSATARVTLLTSAEGRGRVSTVLQLRMVHVVTAMHLVLKLLRVHLMMEILLVLLVHHLLRMLRLLHHLFV